MTTGCPTRAVWTRLSSLLSHPLLGTYPTRTALGVAWLVSVLVAVMAAHWLPLWLLGDERNRDLASTLDGLIAAVIILTLLSLMLAIAYAIWNGGPVLSLLIAVGPVLSGTLASGGLAIELDLVLAAAAGALAATVATYSTGIRTSGEWRPQPYPGFTGSLAICVFVLGFSLSGLVRLHQRAVSHADAGVTAATVLVFAALLVSAGIVVSIRPD